MNLDNLKSRAREATTNTVAKALINSHFSIEKDGGVWTPKAIAKSVGTQLPTMFAVEAVTGSFLTGACMGFIADIGRMQVEGHLYAEKVLGQRDQTQDADFFPVNEI
jgi:hypothetical protein